MRRPLVLPEREDSIAFECIEPERNCYRRYELRLTKDLFGHWVLIRSWGRIGKSQRERREYFLFRSEAKERAQQMVRLRLRHGYRVRLICSTAAERTTAS